MPLYSVSVRRDRITCRSSSGVANLVPGRGGAPGDVDRHQGQLAEHHPPPHPKAFNEREANHHNNLDREFITRNCDLST